MSGLIVDFSQAGERQESAGTASRERVARIHLYLQGGPNAPTDEDRRWVKEWFADLDGLLKIRDETGRIPPSSEYHMERARRFIDGDLDALIDAVPPATEGPPTDPSPTAPPA